MKTPRNVVLVAPYWQDPQHLGTVRVERFVRWLTDAGARVTLITGGITDSCSPEHWGTLVSVRDPLGIYRPRAPATSRKSSPRWRRILRWPAYALLNPDPGILWARRACRLRLVRDNCGSADLILSSSFPESAHIAAAAIAKRTGAALAVDMRDGWLDEPMKPLLASFRLRRWLEGLQEKKILNQAARIFVTSDGWRDLLVQRLPELSNKVQVLTNAYPPIQPDCRVADDAARRHDRQLLLLYAGRIYSSRAERRIDHLLQPLWLGLRELPERGTIRFMGNLSPGEVAELESWRGKFAQVGWMVDILDQALPRAMALEAMHGADGLLLLSSSAASIPAKLFEYVLAQRPILAMAGPRSAVAALAPKLRQLYLQDYNAPAPETVARFLRACRGNGAFDRPDQFDERFLKSVFLSALELVAEPKE